MRGLADLDTKKRVEPVCRNSRRLSLDSLPGIDLPDSQDFSAFLTTPALEGTAESTG